MQGDNHAALVAAVKSLLVSRGVDLSGPCGAFAITARVAWQLQNEGGGLLAKPSGNNCQGYATDIIAYPDGSIFDVLGDAGGANEPAWGDAGLVDPSRYRPAFNPDTMPVPTLQPGLPQPSAPPPAGVGAHAYDEREVGEFCGDAADLYAHEFLPVDAGFGVWSARMQFDAVTIGYRASRAKHLAELRAAFRGTT